MRELPFAWFLRNPAGGVSPRVTSCSPLRRHHPRGPVGGCPRTSSWERRRPRRPITTYCKAFYRHACRFGRKCVNSHLIASCDALPAGAHTLPGVSPRVTSCSPRRRHHPRGPVGRCPRTSSWERRRPRRPNTPYCEAFHGHACRFGRKCVNSHLIASCDALPAGAHTLPGGSPCVTSCSPRRRHHPRGHRHRVGRIGNCGGLAPK